MGIGNLSLTTSLKPKVSLFKRKGQVKQDNLKKRVYKNFYKLDFAEVCWEPHKFGKLTNWGIPYTKVDIRPEYFDRFESFQDYLFDLFPQNIDLDLNQFNISRIEIHSDIENLPLDVILARLWVMGYRRESVSFYKGNTIYIGSNPKIRIFNKTKQVQSKMFKTKNLSITDQQILKAAKPITRFSVEIRNFNGTLEDLVNDPKQLVSYFERFKFYNFEDNENINRMGGLQILMSKIRREHRKGLEQYRSQDLEQLIKKNFISSLIPWFDEKDRDTFDLEKEINKAILELRKIFHDG